MTTTDDIPDVLSDMDRFVRLMAVASGTAGVVDAVRAYLDGWSKERILRLQAADAGWAPFDEYQQPYPIFSANDVRQFGGSVRIRCRELRASDMRVSPQLLELDLFFFFANESLAAHEPARSQAPVRIMPLHRNGFRQSGISEHEQRI
ncbi:MAG: hypothetical protein WAV72_28620 [Bradyrhizobium sp.]